MGRRRAVRGPAQTLTVMAMPPGGTFAHLAIVPAGISRPINDDRLVGHAPALEIDDAGQTPDVRVSPFTGTSEFVPSA